MSRALNQNVQAKKAAKPPLKADKTASDELSSLLLQLLEKNDKLVVLASAFTTHTLPLPENRLAQVVKAVATRFPARFYGLGELPQELLPTANRLSAQGLTPIVLLSSADLVFSYAGIAALSLQRLPVVLLLDGDTVTNQTLLPSETSAIGLLLTLPPLQVGVPAGLLELKYLLQAAINQEDGPVALWYRSGPAYTAKSPVRLNPKWGVGKAYMLREGKDLAIMALGQGVPLAMEAAQELALVGIEATVVDARWARPLDAPLITAIAAHLPRLVTFEQGGLNGGFGAEVLELLEQSSLFNVKVKRLSVEQSNSPAADIAAFLKRVHEVERFNYQLSVIGNQLKTNNPSAI